MVYRYTIDDITVIIELIPQNNLPLALDGWRKEFYRWEASLILILRVFTDGTGESRPDSSRNVLQANPEVSPGRISVPLMRIVGDPLKPRMAAFVSERR